MEIRVDSHPKCCCCLHSKPRGLGRGRKSALLTPPKSRSGLWQGAGKIHRSDFRFCPHPRVDDAVSFVIYEMQMRMVVMMTITPDLAASPPLS